MMSDRDTAIGFGIGFLVHLGAESHLSNFILSADRGMVKEAMSKVW